jgi:hypothetical protein
VGLLRRLLFLVLGPAPPSPPHDVGFLLLLVVVWASSTLSPWCCSRRRCRVVVWASSSSSSWCGPRGRRASRTFSSSSRASSSSSWCGPRRCRGASRAFSSSSSRASSFSSFPSLSSCSSSHRSSLLSFRPSCFPVVVSPDPLLLFVSPLVICCCRISPCWLSRHPHLRLSVPCSARLEFPGSSIRCPCMGGGELVGVGRVVAGCLSAIGVSSLAFALYPSLGFASASASLAFASSSFLSLTLRQLGRRGRRKKRATTKVMARFRNVLRGPSTS